MMSLPLSPADPPPTAPDGSGSHCHTCGEPIATPDELCIACLWGDLLASDLTPPSNDDDNTRPNNTNDTHGITGHRLGAEISRGGMGVVYHAEQLTPPRAVAIKMLHPWQLNAPGMKERFQLEAHALSQLEHPAILPLYDLGLADGIPWFSMKLARGGTLATRLPSYAGQWTKSAHLLITIAEAIEFAHRRGILHRDLKPGNILFDESDHALVADFGLAKLLDSTASLRPEALTLSATVLGTPQYLAPEIITDGGRAATTLSDVYSLGTILYELLAQRPPFRHENHLELQRKILHDVPPTLRYNLASTASASKQPPPLDLELIALKALRKEPAKRYQSAQALASDLQRWLAHEPIHAKPATIITRVVSWSRRRPAMAAALATLGLSASFAIGAQIQSHRRTLAAQAEAAALVSYLNGELTDRLAPSGQLGLLAGVNQQLQRYYNNYPTALNNPQFTLQHARFLYNQGRALSYTGKWSEAEKQLRQSIDLTLPLESSSTPTIAEAAMAHVADAYLVLFDSVLPNLPNRQPVIHAAQEALQRRLTLFEKSPHNQQRQYALADCYRELVFTHLTHHLGDTQIPHWLDQAQRLLANKPTHMTTDLSAEWDLAISEVHSGYAQYAASIGDKKLTLHHYRAAHDATLALTLAHPHVPRWADAWATSSLRLAEALDSEPDTRAETLSLSRDATETSRKLLTADPLNVRLNRIQMRGLIAYANRLKSSDRQNAELLFKEAGDVTRRILLHYPDLLSWEHDVSNTTRHYASFLIENNRPDDALKWWNEALAVGLERQDGSYDAAFIFYTILKDAIKSVQSMTHEDAMSLLHAWRDRAITAQQDHTQTNLHPFWLHTESSAYAIGAWLLHPPDPQQSAALYEKACRLDLQLQTAWPQHARRVSAAIKLAQQCSRNLVASDQQTKAHQLFTDITAELVAGRLPPSQPDDVIKLLQIAENGFHPQQPDTLACLKTFLHTLEPYLQSIQPLSPETQQQYTKLHQACQPSPHQK